MNCYECEELLAAYAEGELQGERAEECRAHIDECASCRETLEIYRSVMTEISEYPAMQATEVDSKKLARALRGVKLPADISPRTTLRQRLEGIGLIVASVLAFLIIGSLTWLLRTGKADIHSFVTPGPVILAVIVVIFISSFIPIAMTARRRPLNGATFRR